MAALDLRWCLKALVGLHGHEECVMEIVSPFGLVFVRGRKNEEYAIPEEVVE
jgi:hypothetical protein